MNIGILATLSKPVTLNSTGGTEVFCSLLAQELSKRGHLVFLFATPQSKLEHVTLIPVAAETRSGIRARYIEKHGQELTPELQQSIDLALVARSLIVAKSYESRIDIFHDNSLSFLTGSVSDLMRPPIVTTMHMPPDGANPYKRIPPYITKNKNIYVPISKWQKKQTDGASEVIYNGIDLARYVFHETGADHLIWIGRISPNAPKGLKEALQITAGMNVAFQFAGNVTNQDYYEGEIKPVIGKNSREVGVIDKEDAKNAFLGNARASLFPIQWDEPFGFVFAESMACGTPVIAYARGSVPEVISDSETGFIVNSSEEDKRGDWIVKKTGAEGMREAIEKMYSLPEDKYLAMRRACRARVEKLFTVERMVKDYEQLYTKLLNQ